MNGIEKAGNYSVERTKSHTFESYLELAVKIKTLELSESLKDVPASDNSKQDLIAMEAYRLAQPSHLHDAAEASSAAFEKMVDHLKKLAEVGLGN